ncbi:cytochrome d ubiquinol oxidase subunit II [Nocardioides sp. TRM66260-LWL]|uniref:cytochrome d ubiquinol oxidase subunit II n=1 Tax=Nocardioides sp. TRM66260-LWL TaxID=2874478 RepID=UPI001CC630DF|nr:cytochrome d ubiquinol oxidase subunit II [Nocardioides sp. TRM66260-LWL]MBZ5735780.1 cytochrome d ubiquinol oxidase subunit II [Nocardioides sp. TRM66260-LWL]
MELTTVWFGLITVLWIGYLCLEGFDFGVGLLLPVLGRGEAERQQILATIGPVWDGNEVWLLVAGGATFAAFPEWYASLFSGLYLPLLLVLVGLIVRGLALEYRGKREDAVWRRRWDVALVVGSALPSVLWGVAFANILRGVPLDARHEYVGGLLDLLSPYALLGGLTTLLLFLTHGATFLALRTEGGVRREARELALRCGLPAALAAVTFLAWTQERTGTLASGLAFAAAAVLLVGGLLATAAGAEGRAFAGTFAAIGVAVAGLFLALFPDVLPTSLAGGASLTVTNAAATPYTLGVMTVVAAVFTPLVLAYQAWTYWVFRQRVAGPAASVGRRAQPRRPVEAGRA